MVVNYLQSIAQNSNGLRKQSKALMQCGIEWEISDSMKIPKTKLYLEWLTLKALLATVFLFMLMGLYCLRK